MTGENQMNTVPGERVAIVGSRDFLNPDLVTGFVRALAPSTIVVSGSARGVDRWAEEAAAEYGLETWIFPADWKTYGRRAGPLRNAKIVAESDRVVAFWDGRSRGTLNTILTARDRGMPIEIFGSGGEEILLLSALVVAEETGVFDAWWTMHSGCASTGWAHIDLIHYLSVRGIYWYEVGEAADEFYGGPVTQAGWYIYPYCEPMCCRPEGPFATREEALRHTRQEYFERKYPIASCRGEDDEH